jgi:glycosyltransferase involved in cell wall biosynthesis
LFTCEEELRLARESFTPYKPQQELNIGYGIAAPPARTSAMTTAFTAQCPETAGKPYVLFLSRIHEKKGVDILVRAYNQLCATRKDVPLLVIAGPGLDTPYGAQVKDLASGNGRILFPSMLLGDTKWGAFYGCDAFVLPSHQENFGIAVAEALACAKPVLISNQVNIWREIQQEGGGLVAPDTEDGIHALLNGWMELASDKKAGMGVRARTAYEKYFSIDQAAQRMKAVLQNK